MTSSSMMDKYVTATRFILMLIGMLAICQQITGKKDTGKKVGICYQKRGPNLPPSNEAISLCNKYKIPSIRLYKPSLGVLESLRGSRISVMLGLPNDDIPRVYRHCHEYTDIWVGKYVSYFHNVNIRYIVVGHDIHPLNNSTSQYVPFLPSALSCMANVVLANFIGLKDIKVSTAFSSTFLQPFTHPMYSSFRPEFRPYIEGLIRQLVDYKSPLLVDIDMYLWYGRDPNEVNLKFALFQNPNRFPVVGNYKYKNMFDAILDGMYFAIDDCKIRKTDNLTIIVSEVGWPTAGGPGASIKNARIFNNKLINHLVVGGGGTPRWPDKKTETYISGLFDDDLNSPEYKKHLGIFNKNKIPKYKIRKFTR